MKIAIVGATGEVGRMMITCMQELSLNIDVLDLYASAKSEGEVLYYLDRPIHVRELTNSSLTKHYNYVLFAAGAGVAHSFAPLAAEHSDLVIDNSSAFRMDEDIALVVPQINGHLLQGYHGIVSNPNCSTIQMLLPLAVLDKAYDLKKVVASTYQAVSGSGHKGILTLQKQREGSTEKGIYPEIIDLNVIPQIGVFMDNGYSSEEEKMLRESRKILGKDSLMLSATTVRVPVVYGHSISVYAEFSSDISLPEATALLQKAEAIKLHENSYITPRAIGNSNESHVCRLRYGVDKHSLSFWNVAHNIRIGAAKNAISIMEKHRAFINSGSQNV
nr:aspartate-semialdehyde dehydrogenase [Candidatus Cloacimonadota bacterium]